MLRWTSVALAVVATFAVAGPRVSRAETSDFEFLTASDATPKSVAETLAQFAQAHSFGSDALLRGSLTLVLPGTDAERKADADRLAKVLADSLEVLRRLGFSLPDAPPPLTVVHVHAKSGRPFTVWAEGGASVLAIRDVDGLRASVPPGPPTRSDGPPLLRDAVESSRRARSWIADAQSSSGVRLGGPGSPAFELAKLAVRVALPEGTAPKWFADGLAGQIELQVAKPAATHVCKRYAAPKPDLLSKLLDDSAPRPPVATRFLARIVGVLVAGRTDVPKSIDALRAAGAGEKAVESAFSISAADLLTKACAGLKPSECACDDTLTVPCPVCKGNGQMKLDCPDCEGSGQLVCPSCRGTDVCPTPCIAGIFYIGYSEVKCKVCSRGKVHCAACGGVMRSCAACSGRKTTSYPCLVCTAGRLPCPDSGIVAADVAPGTACTWCQDPARKFACPDCGGAGYSGCDFCHGTLRSPCRECDGSGEVPRVVDYQGSRFIFGSECPKCRGAGFSKCTSCTSGKCKCATCSGKGLRIGRPEDCPACRDGVLPTRDELPQEPTLASLPLDAGEVKATRGMIDRAIAFMLQSRDPQTGAFCLRDNRAEGQVAAGALERPSLFANADALWTLGAAGVDAKDRRIAGAWSELRRQAKESLEDGDYRLTQGIAISLRALLVCGEDPKGALVTGLVQKLCAGQHPTGWWGKFLEPKSYDSDFNSLFAVESLRMARLKGVKVPSTVWDKVLRAASATFDSKGPKIVRGDIVYGTSVLSNLAIIIIAKEGTLRAKATSFDYASIPQVKAGLAWLDRHFDIHREPEFVRGARIRGGSDSGYSAYLTAVERLGSLLNIEALANDRWHAAGARAMLHQQYEDGSFEERAPGHLNGPMRTTTSCLVFLVKATAPITDVKDD